MGILLWKFSKSENLHLNILLFIFHTVHYQYDTVCSSIYPVGYCIRFQKRMGIYSTILYEEVTLCVLDDEGSSHHLRCLRRRMFSNIEDQVLVKTSDLMPFTSWRPWNIKSSILTLQPWRSSLFTFSNIREEWRSISLHSYFYCSSF